MLSGGEETEALAEARREGEAGEVLAYLQGNREAIVADLEAFVTRETPSTDKDLLDDFAGDLARPAPDHAARPLRHRLGAGNDRRDAVSRGRGDGAWAGDLRHEGRPRP